MSGLFAFSTKPLTASHGLRPAVVTVNADRIVIQVTPHMDKLLAGRRELVEFRPGSLRQNGMAGVTIAGLDGHFFVLGLVLVVVAAETAGPDHVADVVRIEIGRAHV